MAHTIDTRQCGGKLFIFGGSLNLPETIDTAIQDTGAIRFNPVSQVMELFCAPGGAAPAWQTIGLITGGQFLSTGGGTISGDLVVTGSVTASIFNGDAYGTQSADLAERYHADAVYEPGTVVVLGGVNEITKSTQPNMTTIAGIISTAPGLKLNSEAGPDASHPYVALRGRVPCRVTGRIRKGDMLVTATLAGHAMASNTNSRYSAVLGRAIQAFDGKSGVIEVLV